MRATEALLHKDDVYPAGNPGPDDGKVLLASKKLGVSDILFP